MLVYESNMLTELFDKLSQLKNELIISFEVNYKILKY